MFSKIQSKVRERFAAITNTSSLFMVEVDKEEIWRLYLQAFPEATRQEHNCNCCKSFLRQWAGIVGISADNTIMTMWDFDPADPEYDEAIRSLHRYVAALPITGVFLNSFCSLGTEKNMDKVREIMWEHFHIRAPHSVLSADPGPKQAAALADKEVFQRGLETISHDALQTVIDISTQSTQCPLYRGAEFVETLRRFKACKTAWELVPEQLRSNHCWASNAHVSVKRLRNSAIGTLLVDISEGRELDEAVAAYEHIMAPSNYQRPTAVVTPAMVDRAKQRLEELGLIPAMRRRQLHSRDLTVANALFVNRSLMRTDDVFQQIKQGIGVNPKSFGRVEEITINDFLTRVLPGCSSVRALVERHHTPNFVTLVGPEAQDTNQLLKWSNDYSWHYAGGVADALKLKVKNAGGEVDVFLRLSLEWHTHTDLDLHLLSPTGERVYYGLRGREGECGAALDVDMNAGSWHTREPVENIRFRRAPKHEGTYRVLVNNYAHREDNPDGFRVEMEFDGNVFSFEFPRQGIQDQTHEVCQFTYTKKDGIKVISGNASQGGGSGPEKWGIKVGQFHDVRAVTLSPNHWAQPVGNRHFFFMLAGCKADEDIRPFCNEHLRSELSPDRKAFELLGSKFPVARVEDELSGLGFSDTLRSHIFVEVDGSFKRTLKVCF